MNARRASRAQQPPARKRGFHAAPPASHQIIRTIAVQVSAPAIPSHPSAIVFNSFIRAITTHASARAAPLSRIGSSDRAPLLSTKPSALSPSKHRRPQSHPSPALGRYTVRPMLPTKSSAHKRPVDRPVGLRVCRCRYRRHPLADVPKERAAIQLPGTKRPFPKRRAAWGWLPAAAFHPANPQPEASAEFLVPFSKKGTSF